eukprot:11984024-Heterocapsa_arctica.AAC.1
MYLATIEKLVTLFPEAWHLIALADDKARMELFARIRRAQIAAIARGSLPQPDWTAASPWSTCFRLAAEDCPFWDEQ